MPRENAAEQISEAEQDAVSVRSAAKAIEGFMGEDGDITDGRLSRNHPDYEGELDHDDGDSEGRRRQRKRPGKQARNEKGRFVANDDSDDDEDQDQNDFSADDETDDRDSDNTEADNTDEDDGDSTTDDEDSDQSEDTDNIKTLAELADALDISLDDLKQNITHTFKAAGEERTVTLADMERGHQMEVDYQRNKSALAQDKQNFEMEAANRHRALQTEFGLLQQQYGAVEQLLTQGLNTPAMQELRESNPAEWNARQTEVGQQLNWLNLVRQKAAENYQRYLSDVTQKARTREEKALKEKIPDYSAEHDTAVAKTMADYGFTSQEIANIIDHRLIHAAHELATLKKENEELKAQRDRGRQAAKRVTKDTPKMVKPGVKKPGASGNKTPLGISRKKFDAANKRLRQSGKVGDAAKAIENMRIDF